MDFFLSRRRDVNAAKSFLHSAMKNTGVPTKITLDADAASHWAAREMKEDGELPRRVKVRSSQYLNDLVEQDHRRVKQRIRPMPGFKRFDNAAVTISGIELAEKLPKRGKIGGHKARYHWLHFAFENHSRRVEAFLARQHRGKPQAWD